MKHRKVVPTTDDKSAILYVRVSSEEQTEGYSLETQTKDCAKYCEREGISIAKIFREEGRSAKDDNRPQFQAMFDWVTEQRVKPGYVVVYDVSRYSRNNAVHHAYLNRLSEQGVKLRSVAERIDESPQGEFIGAIHAAQAQLDNKVRSVKVKMGMKATLAEGLWPWKAPYGYINTDGLLSFHPERAPVVRLAFERAASGIAPSKIIAELRQRGLKIHLATLYRLLQNKLYTGRLVCLGAKAKNPVEWFVDRPGQHPPLVDELTFQRAQKRIRGGFRREKVMRAYTTGSTPDFPFRGITKCKGCGQSFTSSFIYPGGVRYGYYRCRLCPRNVSVKKVEAAFLEMLAGMATPPEVVDLILELEREQIDARGKDFDEAKAGATKRLRVAERRLEQLTEKYLYGDGVIDPELYRRERQKHEEVIADLKEILSGRDPRSKMQAGLERSRAILQDPLLLWNSRAPEDRPQLLKELFPDGLTYTQEGTMQAAESSLFMLTGLESNAPTSRSGSLAHRKTKMNLAAAMPWVRRLDAIHAAGMAS